MKSLIIYTSITKNTEQVAYTFGSVFEAFGIETTYAKVLPKYKGGEISEYYPEDYDFLCIGCPIIAALPYVNFNSCVGDQEDYKTRNVVFKRRRPISDPDKKRYGIAFTTYGGTGNGPRECIATLEIEKNYLRSYGFTPVGEYACCGKELRHNSVDNLGGQLKMNIPDAQAMMSRYKENPDDEEFKKTSEELTELFKKALDNDKLDIKVEKMKNAGVASMITVSEETRRMQDMMKMYSMGGMDMGMFGGTGETLVLNANHPLVQYVLNNKEGENTGKICEQLYDLASLGHGPLAPERMTRFVNRSNEIMLIMAGEKKES